MESFLPPFVKAKRSDYRRIADGLRSEIINNKLAAGTQLPAMEKLAATWQTSFGTIHNALEALAKEGWVDRVHGAGTYVAHFENRFACAGIYHARDIFTNEEAAFSRALHTSLLEHLGALGKEAQVFVDSRPEHKQVTILPALAEAILHRRIQCLIAPTLNEFNFPALARVNLPTSFATNRPGFHDIGFDSQILLKEGVRTLASQGCRSVGLLSSIQLPTNPGIKDTDDNYYPCFREAVQAAGMATREDWIRKGPLWVPNLDLQRFGYEEIKKLWAQPDKPDGFIIFPDAVVRGAILAILKLRIEVPEQIKFVFHGNAHCRLLCPFPATWAISNEAEMASEMIKMIQDQFEGEPVSNVHLSYSLETDEGAG